MRPADRHPEFSRLVPLSRLNRGVVDLAVEAEPEERQALARRFGLVGLERLAATLRLSREAGQGDVRLSGHIDATVTRDCAVTLEPFAAAVAEDFSLRFARRSAEAGATAAAEEEVECELEGEDIEPLTGETVDVGEAVAQYFYLALEPFPRAPGAAVGIGNVAAPGGDAVDDDAAPGGDAVDDDAAPGGDAVDDEAAPDGDAVDDDAAPGGDAVDDDAEPKGGPFAALAVLKAGRTRS
ncbi:MAG: DUF177 domain-containing protein [Alphaproteobacteria bacterium]|jgi:hypothetical protein|nr:DUF177 domain-containing protein [Alphaproteobacteria bacterium]